MTTTATASAGGAARSPQILAFVSPASAYEQTSMVVNMAWLLATSGRRVLVLDWSSQEPLAATQLRPFLLDRVAPAEPLAPALRVLAGGDPEAAQLEIERLILPGGAAVHTIAASSVLHRPVTLPAEPGAGAGLRALLVRAPYDHVLVDCPTPVREEQLAQLAQLCDGIAVPFRVSSRAVPATPMAMIHQLSRQAQVALRLVALPVWREHDRYRAEEQLDRIRTQMPAVSPHARRQRIEPAVIEVPDHGYDLYEEVLPAVLEDGPLRSAVVRTIEALTGTPFAPQPISERVRQRYERGPDTPADDVVELRYDTLDRRWADWIAAQLRHVGVGVRMAASPEAWQQPGEGQQIVVVGDRLLRQYPQDAVAATVRGDDVVRVTAEDEGGDAVTVALPTIDLRGHDEKTARATLLAQLGLAALPQGIGGESPMPRFPARQSHPVVPPEQTAPPRNPYFNGRATELEALRDSLLYGPGATALVGDAGVGKSEIAREYAHRFADDYDLVWWVPAQTDESVNAALRPLAAALKDLRRDDDDAILTYEADEAHGPLSTLAVLGDVTFDRPYLLVFDNLDDPGVLSLVPRQGHGHVIVTSRSTDLPGIGKTLPVERLRPEDSVALLRSFAHDLSTDDARALADAVDHFPLTLRMAGAWTRESMALLMRRVPVSVQATATTVAQVLREHLAADESAGPAQASGIARTWRALHRSLQISAEGRLAARLAELTAYLASDISLNLLRSRPLVRALAATSGADGELLLADAIPFDEVIWTGVQFGVFDLVRGPAGVLSVHRALQSAIRDGLTEEERADRRSRVRSALAAYAPTPAEDDEPEQRHRLAELQHHLTACDAVRATDPDVRRWVIRQVRYMHLQQLAPVTAAALEIADAALAHWPDDPADILRGWLEVEKANILRWQGRFEDARAIDEAVRQRQRESLGADHLRTHITGRNLGGDLRAAGRYERAKAEDGAAYEGIRARVGEEDRHALMAAHNFALSSYLDGDVHTAMITEQAILERRLRIFGPGHPYTWWSAGNLGTYQRELGDYRGSQNTLEEARMWISERLGAMPPDEMVVLRVDRSLAATRRRSGRPHLATDIDTRVLQAYGRLLRHDHPELWSCRLSLAADQHASNSPPTAVSIAQDCLEFYLGAWPAGHPFTAVCRLNLSVYLRGANQLDEAHEHGTVARRELRAALSDGTHPWNLAAHLNEARNLLALGAVKEAGTAARQVLDLAREDLPPRHPYTLAAADTVRNVARAVKEEPMPDPVRHLDIDIDIVET